MNLSSLRPTRILRAVGLGALADHVNLRMLHRRRRQVAARHLRGHGLEIGALHFPLPVPRGVRVRYVDNRPWDAAAAEAAGFDARNVVRPDLIEDGFTLASVPAESQDFVVANHVLEHSPDPLGTLGHWCRVVKPGGHVFLALPIAEKCFDRGRPETTLEHLLEDRRLTAAGDLAAMRSRNREHYRDWAAISEPNGEHIAGRSPPPLTEAQVEARVEQLAAGAADIHFHTYSEESFRRLLEHFVVRIDPRFAVAEFRPSGGEIIAVLSRAR
jgi:SAM-dependent methyltransferase